MTSKKKNIPVWANNGHKKPVTRREFLSYGLIPFAATAFMPNWLQLLSADQSFAQTAPNCVAANPNMIPFIQLNLEGGAGLASNFLPMDQGRNPLPSYRKIGGAVGLTPITREFGNVPFAGNLPNGQLISNILAGIRLRASAVTLSKSSFIGICARSQNDTDTNLYAMNGLVHRAGLTGRTIPNLGTNGGATGIRQRAVLYSPPAPLIVRNFQNITSSLSYTATLGSNSFNQVQRNRLTRLVANLNSEQTKKLAALNTGEGIKNLLDCAGIKNIEAVEANVSSVDPRSNALLSTLWGNINQQTGLNDRNLIFSSMVFNTLNGNAGSSSLELGGYDYHGSTRRNSVDTDGKNITGTDNKDLEAGETIGRILQSADILQKPLFLYVTTDGGVSTKLNSESDDKIPLVDQTTGMPNYFSDNQEGGMAYIIMYDPRGRVATSDFQIGHYTTAQDADSTTIVGNSSELATQAAFANYLKMNNRMDLYSQIVLRGLTETARINEVVKVG